MNNYIKKDKVWQETTKENWYALAISIIAGISCDKGLEAVGIKPQICMSSPKRTEKNAFAKYKVYASISYVLMMFCGLKGYKIAEIWALIKIRFVPQ